MFVTASSDEEMLDAYEQLLPPTTYESNLEKFGYVDINSPSAINIYVDNFESKEAISKCIETYNSTVSEKDPIQYTDYVGTLMSSVTTIIDVVSYVLMAFVAVSLIVSSIMIGIITYISVLERTKEIGVLRAIGASKHNIQVFSAETFIIGLFAGAIGIGMTLLLLIPGNMLIHSLVTRREKGSGACAAKRVDFYIFSFISPLFIHPFLRMSTDTKRAIAAGAIKCSNRICRSICTGLCPASTIVWYAIICPTSPALPIPEPTALLVI